MASSEYFAPPYPPPGIASQQPSQPHGQQQYLAPQYAPQPMYSVSPPPSFQSTSDLNPSTYELGGRPNYDEDLRRTPSPTPSENYALNNEGFFDTKKMWSKEGLFRKDRLWIVVLSVIILVASIVIVILHDKIVHALKPATSWLKDHPGGWLVPVAILFVLSFPPLFGHEIIAALCGLVWGIGIGFAITILGTMLGEIANYYVFKYFCFERGAKTERKNVFYGCFARVCRRGGMQGFIIALMARYSVIPPHITTTVFATCGMNILIFLAAALLSMPRQIVPVYLGYAMDTTNGANKHSTLISVALIAVFAITTHFAMKYVLARMREVKPEVVYERRKYRQNKMFDKGTSSKKTHQISPSTERLNLSFMHKPENSV